MTANRFAVLYKHGMGAPLFDWLFRVYERYQKYYYEGPEPPSRIRQIAISFAVLHPNATRGDWMEFAVRNAEEFYRSGYIRGIENYDRDEDMRPALSPEEVLELERHDFVWTAGVPTMDELSLSNVPIGDDITDGALRALRQQEQRGRSIKTGDFRHRSRK